MSMTTQDANSIIDSALLAQAAGGTTHAAPPTESALMPGPLPTDGTAIAPPPPTETKDQARIRKAQEDMLGKEAAQKLRDEQEAEAERQKTLVGMAERALQSGKDTAQQANVRIGNIPTPGNLVVPLVLLLFFFFILITFNGNTRMQWLWLVLTGNAQVQAADQTGQSGNGGPDTVAPDAISTESMVTLVAIKSGNGMFGEAYS